MKSVFSKVLCLLLVALSIEVTNVTAATASPVATSWYTENYGYSISISGENTCVVTRTGTVKCWGSNNESGQLGLGHFDPAKSPKTVLGISNAKEVQVGNYTACALLRTGTVKCWGINVTGSVGDGKGPQDRYKDAFDQPVPQTVKNLTGVIDIAGSGYRHCALLANGDVKCWGSFVSDFGEAGPRNSDGVPVKVFALPGAVALDASGGCAITSSGTGLCGADPITGVTGVTNNCILFADKCGTNPDVVDEAGSCQLFRDGHIECVGDNSNGELGVGSQITSSSTPLRVAGIENAVSIAAGSHTCAILATGDIKCWGPNWRGQLGVDNKKKYFLPVTPKGLTGGVFQADTTENSLNLAWIGSLARPGEQVSDYQIQFRKVGESDWSQLADEVTGTRNVRILGLESASSYEVSITPIVAAQPVSPTIYTFVTKGKGAVEFHLQDADGNPLILGNYKWISVDGKYKSSKSQSGSALGVVTFQSVPATELKLIVDKASLANGALVSGTFTIQSSKGIRNLQIPETPEPFSSQVSVQLDSGDPVPNAKVSAMDLSSSSPVSSTDFTGSVFVAETQVWKTNSEGVAQISGFADGTVLVSANYDDGELDQTSEYGDASEGSVTLTLGYLPIVRLNAEEINSTKNSIVEIPISVVDSSVSRISGAAIGTQGVKVSVTPPSGASQSACRGKVLTSTKTNSSGQATLKICASASGDYQIKTSGAVSPGSVTLRVANTAPMPVTSLNVVTNSPRAALVAWGEVLYDGASAITSYKVVFRSGSMTKTYIIKNSQAEFSSRSITLSELPGDRMWTVDVYASNKFGISKPSSKSLVISN